MIHHIVVLEKRKRAMNILIDALYFMSGFITVTVSVYSVPACVYIYLAVFRVSHLNSIRQQWFLRTFEDGICCCSSSVGGLVNV